MSKKMLIDAAHPEETRVVVLQKDQVEDFDFELQSRKPLRGNIYLARVTRVEPSLQAAFVEYGGNRHGFLAFSEIHPDYYQIPVADREALLEADRLEAEAEAALRQAEDAADASDDDQDPATQIDEQDVAEVAPTEIDAADEDPGDDEIEATDTEEVEAASEEANEDADKDESPAAVANFAQDEEATNASEDDVAEQPDSDQPSDAALAALSPFALSAPYWTDEENDTDNGDSESEEVGDPSAEDFTEANASEDDNAEARSPEDETEPQTEASEEPSRDGAAAKNGKPEDDLQRRLEDARRKRARILRRYKIQEVIKRRQILLIQVVKEERGNKGAALTTYLSLAGRYCVLMPNTARGGGVSRKITSATDRKRLRKVIDGLEVPTGMGLIIRTAGSKRTKAEIKRDYEYLSRLWENIRELTLKSIAPTLIYEEASLIKRAIRDMYDKDVESVTVEGEEGYKEAKAFMRMLMPSHAKFVQPYKDTRPLFLKFGIEDQLDGMFNPSVRLRSGGYIVINQTEALVAIDVNSGKATRERNVEATALKTNQEAAVEIARQCRLRDLAGLLVIDFIDMEESRNNRAVERKFKDALKHDRARIQVGRISNFGLLEMSRQRRRSGLVDGMSRACPTCHGGGSIWSVDAQALRVLRALEREGGSGNAATLHVKAAEDIAFYILNQKRARIASIESRYQVTVEFESVDKCPPDFFEIEKSGARKAEPVEAVVRADQPEPDLPEADAASNADFANEGETQAASDDGEERTRKRRRRRRRKDRPDSDQDEAQLGAAADSSEDGETKPQANEDDDSDGGRKRRRRGRRGGRRNRRQEGGASTDEVTTSSEAAETHTGDDAEAQTSAPEQDFVETAPPPELAADETAAPLETPAPEDETAAPPATNGHADHVAEIAAAPEPQQDVTAASEPEADSEPEDEDAEPRPLHSLHATPVSTSPSEDATTPAKKKSGRQGWWQRAIRGDF